MKILLLNLLKTNLRVALFKTLSPSSPKIPTTRLGKDKEAYSSETTAKTLTSINLWDTNLNLMHPRILSE